MDTLTHNQITSVKQRYGIIGNSPGLNYALSIAMRVAPTDLSVLISGESGVGKEIFSKVIHGLSARKHNPFIAVNCGAIPEGTIDSELFGHEKGSFTGAHETRKGYFETVGGGTIFLDEIGEMPIATQARLLRVLETGEFIKVGSSKVQKTDVRVIAASNVDLKDAVRIGKFREDLYYRLNTVPLFVPPLRDRGDDIHLLFRKFSIDFSERYRSTPVRLTDDAVDILQSYAWPGNVRELKNLAEQLSVLASDREVTEDELKHFLPTHADRTLPAIYRNNGSSGDHFSEREIMYKLLFDMRKDLNELKGFVLRMADLNEIPSSNEPITASLSSEYGRDDHPARENQPGSIVIGPSNTRYIPAEEAMEEEEGSLSIADMEKELIIRALKKHRGKRKDAALDLGISERTLYRKIKEYDINE